MQNWSNAFLIRMSSIAVLGKITRKSLVFLLRLRLLCFSNTWINYNWTSLCSRFAWYPGDTNFMLSRASKSVFLQIGDVIWVTAGSLFGLASLWLVLLRLGAGLPPPADVDCSSFHFVTCLIGLRCWTLLLLLCVLNITAYACSRPECLVYCWWSGNCICLKDCFMSSFVNEGLLRPTLAIAGRFLWLVSVICWGFVPLEYRLGCRESC